MPFSSPISYTISTDITAGAAVVNKLVTEINAAAGITPLCENAGTAGDILKVHFDADIPDNEKATLDAVILAHDGINPVLTTFGATTGLFDGEVLITQDATWQDLGGRVTNVQSLMMLVFGHADMSRAKGRIPFRIKTTGSGTQLRIVEIDVNEIETSLVTIPHDAGDTSGLWDFQSFTTDIDPTAGDHLFCLQGRLNGATSATIGHPALTLLDVG